MSDKCVTFESKTGHVLGTGAWSQDGNYLRIELHGKVINLTANDWQAISDAMPQPTPTPPPSVPVEVREILRYAISWAVCYNWDRRREGKRSGENLDERIAMLDKASRFLDSLDGDA